MDAMMARCRGIVGARAAARVFAAAVVLVAAACQGQAGEGEAPAVAAAGFGAADYEIWALDQGLHRLHVYDSRLEEVFRLDMAEHGALVPHMLDFTSDHAYAFVANLASGNVSVIRTADREVVRVIETGASTHVASVSPDDRRVLVASMAAHGDGDGELLELVLDLDREEITVGRRLRVSESPVLAGADNGFRGTSPVCMDFTADGRYAYVSLGPGLPAGGLLVLDVETFEIVRAYPPTQIQANCGTLRSPDGRHMFVNGGSADVGVWYVFDAATHEPVHEASSRGIDAHGVWSTPDGGEVWMVNRVTDNAIIIDPETFEVVAEMDRVGDTPDIIAMSPDGDRAYITLRGPEPVTAAHVAVGETPGFVVVDVPGRRVERVIQPAPDDSASDFHGIGVRVIR